MKKAKTWIEITRLEHVNSPPRLSFFSIEIVQSKNLSTLYIFRTLYNFTLSSLYVSRTLYIFEKCTEFKKCTELRVSLRLHMNLLLFCTWLIHCKWWQEKILISFSKNRLTDILRTASEEILDKSDNSKHKLY